MESLRVYVCVCTCVHQPNKVIWEEIISLPYLGKASIPGDKAQLITLNISDVRSLPLKWVFIASRMILQGDFKEFTL